MDGADGGSRGDEVEDGDFDLGGGFGGLDLIFVPLGFDGKGEELPFPGFEVVEGGAVDLGEFAFGEVGDPFRILLS